MPYAEAFRANRRSSGGESPLAEPVLVPVENQLVNNWCWLATTAAVASFNGETVKQCDLANLALNQDSCCDTPYVSACNKRGLVADALAVIGRLASTISLFGVVPELDDLKRELNEMHPPIGQFEFNGGGEHVVLFAGYGIDADGKEFVQFGDPALGWNPTDVVWSRAEHYRGGARWTQAYWTS